MAKGTIGARIVLEGEKEYRNAIKSINAEQKQLRSEMKLMQTEFKGSQNSLDALTKKQQILTKQYEAQKQKVETYRTALQTASNAEQKAASKVDELQQKYDKARTKMDEMAKATDTTEQEMKDQEKAVASLAQELSSAQGDYAKMSEKVTAYQTSLNNAEADLNEMNEEVKQNAKYLAEAEHSSDGLAKSIDEYGDEVKDASKETNTFGDVLKANLTSEAIIAGVKAIVNGVKDIANAAIESGMAFEASMSNVAALSGATGEELEMLSDKAKELGASTMYSASQSADALSYMALAGWDTKEMLDGIDSVLNLAAAANMDLATSSDIVTDYLTAFGLSAKDAGKFSDQMAYAMSNSNTTVQLLGESYKNVAATATSLGYSVEDVTAVLMTMANAGVKGGEAGTGLSTIMTRLATNTKECADALEDYDVHVYDTEGNMNSLSDILEGLEHVWADLTDEQQANLAKTIAGTQQYSKLQTIMNGVSESAQKGGMSFYDYSEALKDCDGAAKEMASTMQDNLKGKLTILQSALEGLQIASYEVFDDALKDGVDGAAEAVSRLTEAVSSGSMHTSLQRLGTSLDGLIDKVVKFTEDNLPKIVDGLADMMDNADKIVPVVKSLVAGLVMFKTASTAVALGTAAMKVFKAATEGATLAQKALNIVMTGNPFVLVATALATVGVAMYEFAKSCGDATDAMSDVTRQTNDIVDSNKRLTDSIAQSAETRRKNREEIEVEASTAKRLVEKLSAMQQAYRNGADNMSDMKLAVAELNEIMPSLNLSISESTGELNQSTDAILKNVDALMKQAKVEAAKEDLARIAKEQYEAEKSLNELRKQAETQADELASAETRLQDVYENSTEVFETNGSALDGAQRNYQSAAKASGELAEQIEETEKQIEGLSDEFSVATAYIDENTEAIEEKEIPAVEDASYAIQGLKEAYWQAYDNAYTSINGQIGLFEQLEQTATVSAKDMSAALQSETEAMTSYAENLAYASAYAKTHTNTDYKEILSNIESLGLDGAGYLQGLVDATKERGEDFNQLMSDWATMNDTKEQLASTMAEFETSISGGMDESTEVVSEKIGDMATTTEEGFSDMEEVTSKEMKQIGENVDKGMNALVVTIDKTSQSAVTSATNMATSVKNTIKKILSTDEFTEIGKNITLGLANGIKANKDVPVAEAETMAQEIIDRVKSKLDINSPSKVFEELGEYCGKGFEIGFESSFDDVNKTVSGAMNSVVETASSVNAYASKAMPTGNGVDTSILALLSEYLPEIAQGTTDVTVNLEGGTDRLFNVIRQQSRNFKTQTGQSAFA